MLKPNPKFGCKSSKQALTGSSMDSKQLVDSLTAHISLYHSSSSSPSPSGNPNLRSSILKWFSSLTVPQRQAHLTVVDQKFVQVILQMQGKLRSNGHGVFIVLPDIPSSGGLGLPSLCYRRSHGLLARVSESNESEQLIYDSVRLFNSKEGESLEECSCSANCLDSLTVCEDFVENVDRFVAAMDGVSCGAFLRGEEGGLGSEWIELEWLKEKGYYGIEAFVANRLEVALRLSWLNCNSGKKRGVKLKEKITLAGVAANVYWRKKGCMDWWTKLEPATKRNIFRVILGKTAKSLMAEVFKIIKGTLEDQTWPFSSGAERSMRFNYNKLSQRATPILPIIDADFSLSVGPASVSGKPSSLASTFYGLFVLQEIIPVLLSCQHSDCDKEKVLFSSLASVSTISDCIFRKLRGLLMVVSLDFTKLELLEEGNSNLATKKSKEKLGAAGRRKKGGKRNMKKLCPTSKYSIDDVKLYKAAKDKGYGLAHTKVDVIKSNGMAGIPLQEEELDRERLSSAVVMEHGEGSVNENVQGATRKSWKESNEVEKSGLNGQVEVANFPTEVTEVSSPCIISQGEVAKSHWLSENSIIPNMQNDVSTGDGKLVPNSSSRTGGPSREDKLVQSIEENYVVGSTEGSSNAGTKQYPCLDVVKETYEIVNNLAESNIRPPLMPMVELEDVIQKEVTDCRNCGNLSETYSKSVFSGVRTNCIEPQDDVTLVQETKRESIDHAEHINSSGCPSYEWPSVAPVQVPSVNSHLPATTDRLHLDVGHNWKNHFHQSFVPSMNQMRNPPTENGCSRILSRPLPMSLDWPPMVRNGYGLASSVTCSYDSGFISRRQSSFHQGFTAQSVQQSVTTEDERICSGDLVDLSDLTNSHELPDEQDNHWISEEEFEVHAVSGMDYNQYFGGGVMYWDPSDHPGTSFSRPPSLSSDDGSWAWREADMNRAVDDMVAFSSSYSTNGLTSPSTASFCSTFDPLAPGHQAVGYVIPGSEVAGKLLHSSSTMTDVVSEENSGSLSTLPGDGEVKTGDPLPYPILRPIVIPNMSRGRSRSEFKRGHDLKSPCVPPNRREQPRIKRPPSPVVLCVPRAPRPPPPSPVDDSRKHRGFPTVRSGSSSPRHWGVRGLFHDGIGFEEACVRMDGSEVVWPSWRNKSLSAHTMIQPLPGALLQDHLIAISQLTRDQEHPDVAFPLQPPKSLNCPTPKTSLSLMQSLLHDEIDAFCKQVASENLTRKPYINWAFKRVARSLQVLWPRSRTNIYGSTATGLSLPTSDVDLVVCLPPVRNLEPIKEAGILEGRNGIKETCLQHAARYLANQEWVKSDSLKIVENTAIPIIMLVVEVPHDLITLAASTISTLKEESTEMISEGGNPFRANMVNLENSASPNCSGLSNDDAKDIKSIRLDISFKSPSHTGLQTTELVKELTEQFPAATPLALVLKQFLADRSLDQSYSGGLSSYCLVLLITRFLQHEHHHGRPINQNFGSLLMDFFYFFGNVFDPRQMCISVRGTGVYINRERGYSIDPIYIDDPLFPTNNVGRNCFRIHQCIKAFADAYCTLENELTCLSSNAESSTRPAYNLLSKIIPSIGLL